MEKKKIKGLIDFRDRFVTMGCPSAVSVGIRTQSYTELVEHTTETGVNYSIETFPYEHTPERVKSYASSCDYRNDPLQAIACAPKRSNVGDVSSVVDLMSQDSEACLAMLDSLRTKIISNSQKQKEPKNNKEVKENE